MVSYKEKILSFRKSKKLTQTEFARELNVSRSYVAQVEGGIIEPSEGFLNKIVNHFDINRKYFFTDDNKNLNVDLIDKNVHLINHPSVHLFSESKINQQKLTEILDNYRIKIDNLYQRLIDIKLMINKQDSKEIEDGLTDFIDRFAITRNKYINDSTYNRSGIIFYKDIEVIDFKKLKKNEMDDYYLKLQMDITLFEYVFFEYFRKFYNEYMKDWYNKSRGK